MDRFQYAIMTMRILNPANPNAFVWVIAPALVPQSPNLIGMLDALGQMGWEVVAIGDLGANTQAEILLKKRI